MATDRGGDTDMESKKPGEPEKAKARKLYAGVQALGFRRDHMEVHTSPIPQIELCIFCSSYRSLKFMEWYKVTVLKFAV